jgi:cell division protein FtsL
MHMTWMISSSVPWSGLVNYIPLVATVITCALSVILARATLRYAESTDKSLALAREEFEREWSPELHVKLERISDNETRIVVTNLAKISVLLQLLQLRKISQAVPFERCFLNDPLVGGMTWTQDVGKRLLVCTGQDFEGLIAASVTFYCSGRMFRTDWFRFYVQVRDGQIGRINPTNVPARRVRVLENRKGPERRRELAQDVAETVR